MCVCVNGRACVLMCVFVLSTEAGGGGGLGRCVCSVWVFTGGVCVYRGGGGGGCVGVCVCARVSAFHHPLVLHLEKRSHFLSKQLVPSSTVLPHFLKAEENGKHKGSH